MPPFEVKSSQAVPLDALELCSTFTLKPLDEPHSLFPLVPQWMGVQPALPEIMTPWL